MLDDFKAALQLLKQEQREKMQESKKFFVSNWGKNGFEVELKKLKVSDMIEADRYATYKDESGSQIVNQDKKNIFLVIAGVEGFTLNEINLLEDNTDAGIVQELVREILLFSGFGVSLEEVLESKKKD